MFKGAMGKRVFYFSSAILRFLTSIALFIAYFIVKFAVKPEAEWVNSLLMVLALVGLISGMLNLAMCGMPAMAYKTKKVVQVVCFVLTLISGGPLTSTLTGFAVFTRVSDDDIKNENVFNTKTFEKGDKK